MRMNLEAERARAGITRTELAKRIGVSLNTYSEYVKGAPMPSTKLCMLADMFNVTTDYILGRNVPNVSTPSQIQSDTAVYPGA